MILLTTLGFTPERRQNDLQDEATLKALFIYNFTKQIEWPIQSLSNPTFVIGIYGKTEVDERLTQLLANRKIFDKSVEIHQLKTLAEIENCQLVFISKGNATKLSDLFETIKSKGVLIISEEKVMTYKGICINIFEKEDRMTFELSEATLRKANFKVSKQLIDLSSSAK